MDDQPLPRLFLILPPEPAICDELARSTDDSTLASVLIRTSPSGRDSQDALRGAVRRLQKSGIAVLFETPDLALAMGADGVHVNLQGGDPAHLEPVLRATKPDLIVGAGGLPSRHAAMSAAELDIDYVMFGEPDRNGKRPPLAAVLERAQWWCEVFTVPCVVYATNETEIGELANTGADFIAMEQSDSFSYRNIKTQLAASLRAKGYVSQ